MALEVELKAPCLGVEEKVKALGAVYVKSEFQEDTYYTHPCRDFRKTDEALRIRKTDGLFITYKGPKMRSDVKAREEIEYEVLLEAFRLLEVLGFRKAFTISKKRKTYSLDGLTVCCD
jgi:adenylate cyclase, class 2